MSIFHQQDGPAYYNEHDAAKAHWLRELMAHDLIAPGAIDTRSIEDVAPTELAGFVQHHFFAGIGVWSYAARLAGWPDDQPLRTLSCPCQPFSAAGKGEGFADDRNLWPAAAWHVALGRACPTFGEQVASRDGLAWLDVVSADLEAAQYAVAALDLCSAGVGSPNIRQRLYFVADPSGSRSRAGLRHRGQTGEWRLESGDSIGDGRMANADSRRLRARRGDQPQAAQQQGGHSFAQQRGGACDVAHADEPGCEAQRGHGGGETVSRLAVAPGIVADADGGNARAEGLQRGRKHRQQQEDGGARELGVAPEPRPQRRENGRANLHGPRRATAQRTGGNAGILADAKLQSGRTQHEPEPWRRSTGAQYAAEPGRDGEECGPGPTNGFWGAVDWLFCRDGRWRAVEPGTSPLATGVAGRMGLLRGYGDAINAQLTAAYIAAYRALKGWPYIPQIVEAQS